MVDFRNRFQLYFTIKLKLIWGLMID